MKIFSPVFEDNKNIPTKYTCDLTNTNPELIFSEIPVSARSLVLIMDDPDAPTGTFVHWVMIKIDPNTTSILESSVPTGAIQGKNSANTNKYIGPCPPSGTHRYFFKLYALDKMLDLSSSAGKSEVEVAMKDHIIEEAQLIGLYQRQR